MNRNTKGQQSMIHIYTALAGLMTATIYYMNGGL